MRKGKDKLAQQRPDFEQRMAKREARFMKPMCSTTTATIWTTGKRERKPSKVLLGILNADLPDTARIGDNGEAATYWIREPLCRDGKFSGKSCAE